MINVNARQVDLPRTAMQWQVCVIDRLPDLEPLEATWNKLLRQNATRSYFLSYSWARLWLLHLAPPQHVLFILVVKDNDGHVRGLAPFYCASRRFASLVTVSEVMFVGTGGSFKTSEHLDILIERGCETLVVNTLAEFIVTRGQWHRMFLWNVPEHSNAVRHLGPALHALATPCDRPHFVRTNGNWQDIQQSWTRKFRYNLERNLRRLGTQPGAQFIAILDRETLATRLDDFVELHQARWQGKGQPGSFADPAFDRFLRAAIFDAFDRSALRFWCYEIEGRCVAALLAFVANGVAHYFQGGFHPLYAKYSLGSVMIARCLEDCVKDPAIGEFDFMGGGAEYKNSWTRETRTAMQIECFSAPRVRQMYCLERALLSFARRLKRLVS